MKKQIINSCLILIFTFIVFISCDDTNTVEDIDRIIIPSKDVSYSEHLQRVFDVKCNAKGCHNDQDLGGGLSFTSYANTTANYLVVAPGNPQNSKLVWSIEGRSAFPMPPVGYPPLNQNQIDGIKTWIKEGAKNN